MRDTTYAKNPRTRQFAKGLLAAAVGILIGFLIAEIVIRVVPRKLVAVLDPVQARVLLIGAMSRKSDNPRLYYELVPGMEEQEINSAGYRGPEYTLEKPPGVKRIVGIGNSTMFGLSVKEKDVYLRRLEKLLNEDSETPVQVVNLAVPGYNTNQELEMLRTRGLAFDPDLVILGYDHNDPKPILGRYRPPMPDDYGRNFLHSEFIRYLMRTFYSRPPLRYYRRVDGHITRGPGWDSHFDTLAAFAGECTSRGISVLVVVYDGMIHRENKATSRHYRLLHEPFTEFWKEHGFYVVDCYDLFQEYMKQHDLENVQSLWVSVDPRDAHPNPKGHQIIADAVFDEIKKHSLIH